MSTFPMPLTAQRLSNGVIFIWEVDEETARHHGLLDVSVSLAAKVGACRQSAVCTPYWKASRLGDGRLRLSLAEATSRRLAGDDPVVQQAFDTLCDEAGMVRSCAAASSHARVLPGGCLLIPLFKDHSLSIGD